MCLLCFKTTTTHNTHLRCDTQASPREMSQSLASIADDGFVSGNTSGGFVSQDARQADFISFPAQKVEPSESREPENPSILL